MTTKLKYKGWKLLLSDKLLQKEAQSLFDAIQNNQYTTTQSLKNHHRSVVTRIDIFGKDLVLKIPVEKNARTWIRLMSWFRMGEAFKNQMGMHKLWNKSIPTTRPVMAAEKRSAGMVVDSWLLYEFLDGQTCLDRVNQYPAVVAKLEEMHQKKLVHGDSQIRNFISVNDEIYVIDSNPKQVGNAFDRAYEWAYLRKSAPGIEDYFGEINDWWLYKVAFWYDIYERRLAKNRKKVKKVVKGFFFSK